MMKFRRFPIKTLKHLPYQMATLYFILFVLSILASMITVNCGDNVFKKYTSCHGTKVYNINWIGFLIILQILLLFVTVEPETVRQSEDPDLVNLEDHERVEDYDHNPEAVRSSYNLLREERRNSYSIIRDEGRPGYSMGRDGLFYEGDLSRPDYVVQIEPARVEKRHRLHLRRGFRRLSSAYQAKEMDHNVRLDLSDSLITTKIIKARDMIKKRVRICWSSIWMVSYNFVIFMGVHGSVLASRIHANISLNKYGIETCSHLTYFPLTLSSPVLKDPILSEAVFLITYLSFTIHEIVIRKTENCFLIKNFFGKHYFKESVVLGSVRLIIQIVLFSTNIAIIFVCILSGFGSPMHVLVGFSISMLALWVNSLLSQLLELTHYGEMKAPTLEYSYIWSILSAFVLWFCGFFYYTSVYGVPYKKVYFYLNPISWILLIGLTWYKRREIFNASQYLQGFVPTFT